MIPPTNEPFGNAIEFSSNRRHSSMASIGGSPRGWLEPGSAARRRRESEVSGTASEPKRPVSAEPALGRIDLVLERPLSYGSSRHSRLSTGLLYPAAPASSSSMSVAGQYSSYNSREALVRLDGAGTNMSGPAMMEATLSVDGLETGRLEYPLARAPLQPPITAMQPQRKWWWQKPRWKGVQNALVTLIISAVLCVLMLLIYLGLALCKHSPLRQEWHVLSIFIILVAALFFCHSLIRVCVTVAKSERVRSGSLSTDNLARIPSTAGPEGYANPQTPIRINTQDPQIMGGITEPPPVYGLWRCSVRANPSQFYWVHRQSSGLMQIPEQSRPSMYLGPRSGVNSPRPPSYISDDGVSYAVNAAPVNAAPEMRTGFRLPPHPSEWR